MTVFKTHYMEVFSNVNYVIKKLKKFNFPIINHPITTSEQKELEDQIKVIEGTIKAFKDYLKKIKSQTESQD